MLNQANAQKRITIANNSIFQLKRIYNNDISKNAIKKLSALYQKRSIHSLEKILILFQKNQNRSIDLESAFSSIFQFLSK